MTKRLLNTQRIVNLSSDPGSGTAGEIYYNTGVNALKIYTGSSWSDIGGSSFPDQTGQSGKFLSTNGTSPSWNSITKTTVGLANVENTALSTWAGSTNITTLGTVATGTWQGSSIATAYTAAKVVSVNGSSGVITGLAVDNTVVHLAGTETITGAKTFSATTTFSGNVNIGGVLDLTNAGVIGALDMSNNSISGVNTFSFSDPGVQEGITWSGGNGWWIYESPDNLTNAAGNLQIVQGSTRRATFKTDGVFEVVGSLIATTKSFDIEHPTKEKMRLRYGSLEGPENGVYIRGRSSSSTITLPDYWTGLVDEDSITVQLTPVGKHRNLYVKDISNNAVEIGGVKGEFFYFIQAERKDVDKLVVEYGS